MSVSHLIIVPLRHKGIIFVADINECVTLNYCTIETKKVLFLLQISMSVSHLIIVPLRHKGVIFVADINECVTLNYCTIETQRCYFCCRYQ